MGSVMWDPWERGRPARFAMWRTFGGGSPVRACGRDARAPRFMTGNWFRLCRVGLIHCLPPPFEESRLRGAGAERGGWPGPEVEIGPEWSRKAGEGGSARRKPGMPLRQAEDDRQNDPAATSALFRPAAEAARPDRMTRPGPETPPAP